MKRLIPLMIAVPLLAACGSDSDSDGETGNKEAKQPSLPTLQLSSTNNATANANLNIASGVVAAARTQLTSYGNAKYSNNSDKETWSYSANGLTVTLEYSDGAQEDSWQLTMDGKVGETSFNQWLAWRIVEQDADESIVMTTYKENSSDVASRLSANKGRVQHDTFDPQKTFVVIQESETSGRLLNQTGSDPVSVITWAANDQVVIYSNCGTDLAAAETGNLATLCSANEGKTLQPVAKR